MNLKLGKDHPLWGPFWLKVVLHTSPLCLLAEKRPFERPARAAMFGTWRDLTHVYQISDLLTHFNVSDDVWNGFLHQIGPLGEDVRLLAALPRLAIVAACSNALHGDGSAFVPVDATQVGLVWRMARRVMAFRAGIAEENFTDEDPWSQSPPSTTPTVSMPGPTTSGSGVKERVLKMSSLIDQQDESELVPPTPDQVHGWVQNFVKIMGSMPDEIEEPTGNQLAGLAKRVISQGGSPYVDFAVWVPFERKLAKNNKFRIYTPLGDESFSGVDLVRCLAVIGCAHMFSLNVYFRMFTFKENLCSCVPSEG